METNQIVQFLQAIDNELAPYAAEGERLDFQIIGRAVMIIRYGLTLATKDVDLARTMNPGLEAKAIELFGKATARANEWGLYLDPVPAGLPPVPAGTSMRSSELPGSWKVLRPRITAPNDLAVTKLKRFHSGDREDIRLLCDSGEVSRDGLLQSLDLAYPFGMDEEEDPSHKRVNENLRKVLDYLDGRSRSL